MSSEGSVTPGQTSYRKTRLLLLLGIAVIGFTRLEDRAIIGAPGGTSDAMAAMAIPPSEEVDDGSFADAPDGVVRVGNATRIPRNRIRRALRERDFNTVAARDAVPAAPVQAVAAPPSDFAAAAASEAFTAPTETPLTFASLGPGLGPTATPVFTANLPPSNGGGGSSGGGGNNGGNNGGGDNGGSPGTDPVSAVPEPATWLSLMIGLFGIGGMLRRKRRSLASLSTPSRI